MPADEKQHIVWKTLQVVKGKFPGFRLPEVVFKVYG